MYYRVIFVDEKVAVPLPVLDVAGSIQIVNIPHLSEAGLEFLREALDTYKPAIVRAQKAKHPPKGRVIGPEDAIPGEVA